MGPKGFVLKNGLKGFPSENQGTQHSTIAHCMCQEAFESSRQKYSSSIVLGPPPVETLEG